MGMPNFQNRTLYYGDNLPALRRNDGLGDGGTAIPAFAVAGRHRL